MPAGHACSRRKRTSATSEQIIDGKQITGNGLLLSGSISGDYRPSGTYNGQPYYVRGDGSYYIFY